MFVWFLVIRCSCDFLLSDVCASKYQLNVYRCMMPLYLYEVWFCHTVNDQMFLRFLLIISKNGLIFARNWLYRNQESDLGNLLTFLQGHGMKLWLTKGMFRANGYVVNWKSLIFWWTAIKYLILPVKTRQKVKRLFLTHTNVNYTSNIVFLFRGFSTVTVTCTYFFSPWCYYHLKATVCMGDGWRVDFHKTHFDKFFPPDFYARVWP